MFQVQKEHEGRPSHCKEWKLFTNGLARGKKEGLAWKEHLEGKVKSGHGPPRPATVRACFGKQNFREYLDQFSDSVQRENWNRNQVTHCSRPKVDTVWTKLASVSITKKGPKLL